jgi:hypothetical protein
MRLLTAMFFTFVVFGLTGSGCASGEANISTGKAQQQDASAPGLVGSCNPIFCQPAAGASGCCMTPNGPCGLNFGNGCVARTGDGG